MRFAFIMDPLDSVKAYKDTTYFLMLGAKELGHQVFHVRHGELYVDGGKVFGRVTQVVPTDDAGMPFRVETTESVNLDTMDVVMIRPDPPFDRRYFYTTLLLELLPSRVLVVNRPQTLRDWNEKLAALKFPELGPRTLISACPENIVDFMTEIGGRITVKPVDGYGGRGIFFLRPDDANCDQILNMLTVNGKQWIVVQEYLEAAREGDKRILLLEGEPLGAVLRVHPPDKEINNLDAGGTAFPVELTSRDREICDRLKPYFLKNGLVFVGIDVIGDALIEINVTSPTGLRELARFTKKPHHQMVIQRLEHLASKTIT